MSEEFNYTDNVDLDLFSLEEKFSTDLKTKSVLTNFAFDEENNIYLFYSSDNTIIYLNESKNLKKRIEGLYKNQITNLSFIIDNSTSACVMLFENGDLFIIPCSYLETDYFDQQWKKIVSNSNTEDNSFSNRSHFLQSMESIIKSSFKNKDDSHLNFSDLLICSRIKSNDRDSGIGMGYPSSLKILRSNNFQIFYKNINTSYIQMEQNNMKNTSIIHWTCSYNNNSDYSSSYYTQPTQFLILNVDFNLMFINLNNLECVNKLLFNLGDSNKIQLLDI